MGKNGKKQDSTTRKTTRKKTRKILKQVIVWAGIIIIGILAVPTGVLIALISAVWSVTDKILGWMGDEKNRVS